MQIDADGTTLDGEEAGEGSPVVLLHGLTATRRYVVMGSKALERAGHRVVLYDARAHGQSEGGDEYSYERLAADLLAVLDDRGIDRATLAGASMGAHTITRFALQHPDRVNALVIMTPAYAPDRDPGLERWDRLANGLRTGGVDGFVEAYGTPKVPEKWHETILRVLHQRLSAHAHPDALADALSAVPRSRPFEAWEDLAQIEAPTVIVASRDEVDPEHPFAVGERYAEAIPDARLLTEDEGASPLAWQGAQVSKIIAEAVP
ncbi:alpha/beta hydrolase [Solirubrobacter sp. CPCC 204708]|uniref:Alpha/beta hydrolase n=1 Tax=Solirubrobacter deserti TaxID=2282478 RepID=A0ABT4RV39_9ACTN|nr:alpha/beta hydrolase [Solirubrobacter deserti]MBE2315145.1 alpha/beta hydrolase [Solirubrobacter deserti]MDA0142396.1 alpha/beta hydrolase [Solirubrobacter deserti]